MHPGCGGRARIISLRSTGGKVETGDGRNGHVWCVMKGRLKPTNDVAARMLNDKMQPRTRGRLGDARDPGTSRHQHGGLQPSTTAPGAAARPWCARTGVGVGIPETGASRRVGDQGHLNAQNASTMPALCPSTRKTATRARRSLAPRRGSAPTGLGLEETARAKAHPDS
jgi:hypothetical protein